ncbi:unnamed protein product, partial [Ostreobium quekettii]
MSLTLLLAGGVGGRPMAASERMTRQLLQDGADDGGFLAGDLPLEIVATTPADLAGEGRVEVGGEQALTVGVPHGHVGAIMSQVGRGSVIRARRWAYWLNVLYSRSVIALGEDFGSDGVPQEKLPFTFDPEIPGSFRWVTTSIARFDPAGGYWPDREINLVWNRDLTTFDGVKLNLSGVGPTVLVTPTLFLENVHVDSDMAQALTDGRWCQDCTYFENEKFPEVPPDGIVVLEFSHDVSPSTLQENMKVLRDGDTAANITAGVTSCEPDKPESSCVNVTFTGGQLETDTWYFLVLEEGLVYSNVSGGLSGDLRVELAGLRRFRIPLGSRDTIRAREFVLPLVHGLAPETTVDDVKASMSVKDMGIDEGGQEMEFELSLRSKGELLLRAAFVPETDYTIEVSANDGVKDGFGLSLEASVASKTGERLFHEFAPIFPVDGGFDDKLYAIFEAGQEWDRSVSALSRGLPVKDNFDDFLCEDGAVPFMEAWPLKASHEAFDVFSAGNFDVPQIFKDLGVEGIRLDGSQNGSAIVAKVDATDLLDPAGIFYSQFCFDADWLTMETEVMASFLAPGDPEAAGEHLLAWVHDMATGQPVQGANITIWQRNDATLEIMDTAMTAEDGTATLVNRNEELIIGFLPGRFAAIEHAGRLTIVPGVEILETLSKVEGAAVSSVLDRKLARPGETVHVKGHIWRRENADLLPFTPENGFCLDAGDLGEFPVQFDDKFGSFQAEIELSEDAVPREYDIFLVEDCEGNRLREYLLEGFAVGDPRPPTAVLDVKGPDW